MCMPAFWNLNVLSHNQMVMILDTVTYLTIVNLASCSLTWSAPLNLMRVLYEGSHKEIFDDQKAKTTKA